MSTIERAVGRPWTTDEDTLLRQAVATHGENDQWKAVALSVPGRTNKACRKRWLHSLSPSVKKSAWTTAEDRLLLDLYAFHSTKWSVIARQIPGRTDDACSKRYREALDPSLKKDEWNPEEDSKLLAVYARLGGKWGQVGQELSRSGLGCRNRWRLLERKRQSAEPSQKSPDHRATVDAVPGPRDDSPQNNWSHISMMEPTHFWTDENSQPQYDVSCSTLSSGHHSSHIRTQEPLAHPSGPSVMNELQAFTESFPYPHYSMSSAFSDIRGHRLPLVNSPPHRISATFDLGTPVPDQNPSQASTLIPEKRSDIPMDDAVEDFDSMSLEPELLNSTENLSNESVSTAVSQTHTDSTPDIHQHHDTSSPLTSRNAVCSAYQVVSSDMLNVSSPPRNNESELSYRTPHNAPSRPGYHHHNAYYRSTDNGVFASKRFKGSETPARLSADLPVTSDPSICPYACGHRVCWPNNIVISSACFVTSRELSDHNKQVHANDTMGGGKPFRCGLDGCGKSWKSINGLQYHLQISKAHFQRALSAANISSTHDEQPAESTPEKSGVKLTTRKIHLCPRAGCSNQYKQLSGLRYHLAHGHPNPGDIPVQLDVVPPMLSRRARAGHHNTAFGTPR